MIECPYCGDEASDPEDYCNEDSKYERECYACGKNFVFTVAYSVDYFAHKADCLNGAPHQYKVIDGWCKRCTECGRETREKA